MWTKFWVLARTYGTTPRSSLLSLTTARVGGQSLHTTAPDILPRVSSLNRLRGKTPVPEVVGPRRFQRRDTLFEFLAIVGTGSTGAQMVQEIEKEAKELTLFPRMPDTALLLCQCDLTPDDQEADRPNYPAKFLLRYQSTGDYDLSPAAIKCFDHSPEERLAFFEDKGERGGFLFWSGAYQDQISDLKANRAAYNF